MKTRDRLRGLLAIDDPPRRVAAAFAVGVFIGMSPLLGLHTVLALLIAWAFRLNRFVAITGVYITNPWTIVPIYAFSTWVGALITGADNLIPAMDWNHMTMQTLIEDMGHLLVPFLVGTTAVGLISGALSYIIIKKAVERARG